SCRRGWNREAGSTTRSNPAASAPRAMSMYWSTGEKETGTENSTSATRAMSGVLPEGAGDGGLVVVGERSQAGGHGHVLLPECAQGDQAPVGVDAVVHGDVDLHDVGAHVGAHGAGAEQFVARGDRSIEAELDVVGGGHGLLPELQESLGAGVADALGVEHRRADGVLDGAVGGPAGDPGVAVTGVGG